MTTNPDRSSEAAGAGEGAAGTAETEFGDADAPFISVDDLRTYYDDGGLLSRDPPVKAVDGVTFDVHEGETLGLVGESGCGKTTLGRTLVGLESATDGTVRVEGEDVTELSGSERRDWQRRVGMVFQDPQESLNDRQTVGEIVGEPLQAHGWPFLTVAVTGVDDAVVRGSDAEAVDGDAEAVGDDADTDGHAGPADLAGERGPGDRADVTVHVGPADHEVSVRERAPLDPADVSVAVDRGGDGDSDGVGDGDSDGDGRTVVSVSVGKSKAEMRRDRVFALLDRVGLNEEHYYRYPHQFSGGQRQRVGIARALALEPDFLVLDEPVSALDVSVQARIINLLEDIQAELGLTYLFIAHDLSVVRHIADRVAVMYLGSIVELGPAESVYTDPSHPYTLSLLSAIPGSGSPWTGERVTLRGTPPSPRYPPAGCSFTTRCPAKIRPDGWDLAEETWRALEELRIVFRTRARSESSAVATVKRLLGREVDVESVETTVTDLLGDRSLPPDARAVVDEAVDLARHGDDEAAAERLREAFGSRCDEEHPRPYDRGEGWRSRCLRHESEYRDAPETIDERERRDGN